MRDLIRRHKPCFITGSDSITTIHNLGSLIAKGHTVRVSTNHSIFTSRDPSTTACIRPYIRDAVQEQYDSVAVLQQG